MMWARRRLAVMTTLALTSTTTRFLPVTAALSTPPSPKRVAVFGGTGYVGSTVCDRLVKKGYDVTAVSRRGANPRPNDSNLEKVKWVKGDATDPDVVKEIVSDVDAVVHAIGLLFDVESGLANLNTIVSGSGSLPGEESTYDAITRQTMFNVIESIEAKVRAPSLAGAVSAFTGGTKSKMPVCFVSAAEAGWPDVAGGSFVEEKLAPKWLTKYLVAKRAVEARLSESDCIRAAIYRPSLIWDWTKFDVLPVIPVFNAACALGIPFVDKTVRVETLADAIAEGIEDESVTGVQRYMQMEELAARGN